MSAWRSMKELLEVERRILLDGRLGDLGALQPQRERLLQRLEDPAPDALKRDVGALANRNAELISAAGRGVKAALQQLTEAQNLGGLRTYDGAGAAHEIGDSRSRVERKA